jgi:hypothetical protein
MNKRKLQEFATWAKLNLENQIELSLKQIGINSEHDVRRSKVQGDVTIIEGIEKTFNRQFNSERDQIINIVRTDGYKHTIEQFASTWFNRIIAIRFLEIHEYLDHGFKVFPNEPNTLPEILSNLNFVKEDLNLDMTYIEELTGEGNNKEELYRYILFRQCNALAKPLPMLFSSDMDYLEYFIPTPLLFGDTIINRLLEIEEDDFKDDVEIIGWLYQFYIATKKDEVFASKEKVTKDTLPAVTQLFTPEWIVKYMAENSIGRIWLESYPNSPLKDEMKYFVDEAAQEPEVEEKLKEIRYKNVNPEDIKIIEPCSGSGHILVYCFDLLQEMYIEKGYVKRDIPRLILKNNLVGLDIDKRATQLASFALVMRARSIDNRFFEEDRYIRPKVYEIIDSKALLNNIFDTKNYKQIIEDYNNKYWKGENKLNSDELKVIEYVVNLFEDAKVIGSLLKVKPEKYLTIRKKLAINNKNTPKLDIFTSPFFNNEFKQLLELLRLAHFMSLKYDVMITNPPYQAIGNTEDFMKKYADLEYPLTKLDMYSMFMEREFCNKNGFVSMINQHQWMFISSFEKYRKDFIKNKIIINMLHLGPRAFDTISGEKVQSTTFVLRNSQLVYNSVFFRLTDYKTSAEKEESLINALTTNNSNKYVNPINNYQIVPGSPFAYWIKEEIIKTFNNKKIEDYAYIGKGLDTCNQDRFERKWFEVSVNKLSFDGYSSEKKWFLFSKGGGYRRWYGNLLDIVLWENDGDEIRNYRDEKGKVKSRPQNINKYFKNCVTWSSVGTGSFGARIITDAVYGNGAAMFTKNIKYDIPLMGLLNSNISREYLSFLSPTLTFNAGDLKKIPVDDSIFNNEDIRIIIEQNINIMKKDWSSYEYTWEFLKNRLIPINSDYGSLKEIYDKTKKETKDSFSILHENEEKLNKIFIKIYGLDKALDYKVKKRDVSVRIVNKNEVKELISYLIGILMGRYSLVKEGLIYAGGRFDFTQYGNYDVDKNGIIPIYSDINVEDGLVHRILGLIKKIYGEDNYRENIGFIAEALGKRNSETNEETLNRYLNDDFYNDHLKTYQKRPIYWMFSSGKLSGFKALIYMHRYDENTLAKLNASYFQPATTILRNQISEIEKLISISSERELNQLNKKRLSLVEQLKEAIEYGQVLDCMANQYIKIDLDDGVKVNYEKFQNVKLVSDRGKLTKDLLIPIK